MRYHLPPLNALRAFEAAARHQSISQAANELHVTGGAVSRHISRLEEYFRCELIKRQPRGIILTEKGDAYFRSISGAFEGIDQASRHLSHGASNPERLSIRLYTTFTTEWLAPRLSKFRAEYPSIELNLTANLQRANFDTDEIDIGVTSGLQRKPELHFDTLFRPKYVPVCVPALVDQGLMARPRDLLRHTLLYAPLEVPMWHAWFKEFSSHEAELASGLKLDNLALTYQAARSGAGIALGLLFYIANDLIAGNLVAPFPLLIEYGPAYSLVCRTARKDEPAISAFRRWILQEAQNTNLNVEHWLRSLQSSQVNPISSKVAPP
jgi:LysR family transcriptional regulator, glycine cleavage system transcriptional activator